MGRSILLLVVLLWATGPQPAIAQEHLPQIPAVLLQAYLTTAADDGLRVAAAEAGAARAIFCSQCHGEDGNSTRAYVPKLAGQDPLYLLEQLERFSDGRRNHYVMVPLARNLADEDKINLVLNYAGRHQLPASVNVELAARGRDLYREACVACHAEDGRGVRGYARLAGQQPEYLINRLDGYRTRQVKGSPEMEQVTAKLGDDQIQALAHYASSLGR